MLLYEGPSRLDGKPIVCIGTQKTSNQKTGQLIQTWILRADLSPVDAIKAKKDSSICGDCKHRHANDGACYVIPHHGPLQVWKAYRRGRYVPSRLPKGAPMRLGSYGDPAALPEQVVERLCRGRKQTGYTHQWRTSPHLIPYCMASVDNEQEYWEAKAEGWRTFRTRLEDEPLLKGEFECPASEEQGKRLTCAECMACGGGSRGGSPAIVVHGYKASRFTGLTVSAA